MTRVAGTVSLQAILLTIAMLVAGCTPQQPDPTPEDPIAYLLADAMLQAAAVPVDPPDAGIYRVLGDEEAVAPARDDHDRGTGVSIDWTGPLLGLMELAGGYFDYGVVSDPAPPATPVLVGLKSDRIELDRLASLATAAAGDAASIDVDHGARRIRITYAGGQE